MRSEGKRGRRAKLDNGYDGGTPTERDDVRFAAGHSHRGVKLPFCAQPLGCTQSGVFQLPQRISHGPDGPVK